MIEIKLNKEQSKSSSYSRVLDFSNKSKDRIVVMLYHGPHAVPISNHINSPRGARAALRKRYMTLREHPDWLVGFDLNGAVMPVHEIMQIAQAEAVNQVLAKIAN
jgi:hypothetical protein